MAIEITRRGTGVIDEAELLSWSVHSQVSELDICQSGHVRPCVLQL